MTSSVPEAQLGDYVDLQRGNTYKSSMLGSPGPVLLGLGSIGRNGGFKSDNLKTYGGYSDPRMLLDPGDVYVSLKDVTQSADLLGAVSPKGRLTQDTVKLVFKAHCESKDYIYWLLRTPQYREFCRAHATGTTNLGLPRDDFLSFPIPSLTKERAELVVLLEALDSKIDLNRRMNETLKAMADALFKDWFVDFGPTRAKMGGRASYLAAEIWALFPDRLDDEGKPVGWNRGTLFDLCELKRGYDLPTIERRSGAVPIISSSGVSGFHDVAMVDGPGVVTGRYGTIGEVFYIERPFWPLNTALYVRDFKGNSTRFVHHTLRGIDFNVYSDKGAVPGINRNHLHLASAVIPPSNVQGVFDNVLSPVWMGVARNEAENATLAALRSLVLPKLITSDIRLKDAAKIIERAA